MMRFLIPLLVFLGLAVVLAVGLNRDPTLVPSPLVGKPAPEFDLPNLLEPGGRLRIEDFKGHVSLVNVWASWCAACRDEHLFFLELARRNVVPIYGLNYKDTDLDARKWLDRYGNPYTAVAVDQAGKTGIDWGVYGVPETFILDRNGVIRHKVVGPVNETLLQEEVLPLIRQLQAEGP
jgi:cytochrome c biogenesis protein CcmG/thiol:disulfide interchange protein DsbE